MKQGKNKDLELSPAELGAWSLRPPIVGVASARIAERKKNIVAGRQSPVAPKLPPAAELAYDVAALERTRQRKNLTHEDLRSMARPFLRGLDPKRSADLLSRNAIRSVLSGNPHTEVGSVYAVLCVLDLTWADVVIQKREARKA